MQGYVFVSVGCGDVASSCVQNFPHRTCAGLAATGLHRRIVGFRFLIGDFSSSDGMCVVLYELLWPLRHLPAQAGWLASLISHGSQGGTLASAPDL